MNIIKEYYKNVPVNIIEPLKPTAKVREIYQRLIDKRFTDTIVVWSDDDPYDKRPGVMLRPGYNPAIHEGVFKVIKLSVEGNIATIVLHNLIPDDDTMAYIMERAKLFWCQLLMTKVISLKQGW